MYILSKTRIFFIIVFLFCFIWLVGVPSVVLAENESCRCEYRFDDSEKDFNLQIELDVEYPANDAADCKQENTTGDLHFYNCEWVEELELGETGCCDIVVTDDENKKYLFHEFVGSKEATCGIICDLYKKDKTSATCSLSSSYDKEDCVGQKSGALGCCSVWEDKTNGKVAYAPITPTACVEVCNSKQAGLLACTYKNDMVLTECLELSKTHNLDELIKNVPAAALPAAAVPAGAGAGVGKAAFDIGVDVSVLNKLSSKDVKIVIGNAIKTGVGLMGSIALAMFIYGGVLWMSSAGSAERSKKGLQVILWAAMGMFMILMSYAIVNFVFQAFK